MEDSSNFIEKMMELGIGMSIIQKMPEMMAGAMPSLQGQSVTQPMPPPISQNSSFYLVLEGSQAGPFSTDELKQLIGADILKTDTLVWKVGMTQWNQASQVAEINKLFLMSKVK